MLNEIFLNYEFKNKINCDRKKNWTVFFSIANDIRKISVRERSDQEVYSMQPKTIGKKNMPCN